MEDIRAALSRLYAEQITAEPENAYLRYHGAAQAIASKVASFEVYRPFIPPAGRILDLGCQHAPDAFMVRMAIGSAPEIVGADFRPAVTRFSGTRAALNSSRLNT